MTERESMTGPEARAREALRALGAPRADEDFRARLKREFMAGPAAGGRVAAESGRRWWHRPAWQGAVAGACVLTIAVPVLNRGPRWQLVSGAGDGIAVIDRRPIPLGHREDLGRALAPGARLTLDSGSPLEIESPGHLVIQVTPGTELSLPGPPGRWFGREVRATVGTGEVRITTGPRFAGARLRVDTPEAGVLVSGTTLAVICEPGGTCVCVYEGSVRVGEKGRPMSRVERGRRRFVFVDGRPPEDDSIRANEGVELARFRDQHRARLERAAE
ncbi:MAG TPA: FecR domain-containing protein [Candidatus Eisenbacteria bacterium]|jgi:hypothetical protein